MKLTRSLDIVDFMTATQNEILTKFLKSGQKVGFSGFFVIKHGKLCYMEKLLNLSLKK